MISPESNSSPIAQEETRTGFAQNAIILPINQPKTMGAKRDNQPMISIHQMAHAWDILRGKEHHVLYRAQTRALFDYLLLAPTDQRGVILYSRARMAYENELSSSRLSVCMSQLAKHNLILVDRIPVRGGVVVTETRINPDIPAKQAADESAVLSIGATWKDAQRASQLRKSTAVDANSTNTPHEVFY